MNGLFCPSSATDQQDRIPGIKEEAKMTLGQKGPERHSCLEEEQGCSGAHESVAEGQWTVSCESC